MQPYLDLFNTLADLQPDRTEAEKFIAALTGSANTPVTFQTFRDTTVDGVRFRAQVLHGTLTERWDELVDENRRGAGVFIMVNAGDRLGRKTFNVTDLRAVFIDEDGVDHQAPPLDRRTKRRKAPGDLVVFNGPDKPPFVGPVPSITVRSKNGQHNYWRLELEQFPQKFADARKGLEEAEREIAKARKKYEEVTPHLRRQFDAWRAGAFDEVASIFERAQKTLSGRFNTDSSICDLPRVMRLPGFYHLKNPAEPFLVEVLQVSGKQYRLDEVLTAYPSSQRVRPRRRRHAAPNAELLRSYPAATPDYLENVRRYMASCPQVYSGMEGGGDLTAYKYAAALLNDWALTEDEATPIWDSLCRGHERFSEAWREEKFANAQQHAKNTFGCKRDVWDSRRANQKPEIVVSLNQSETVDRAVEALAKAPEVFQRGNRLVRLVGDDREHVTPMSPRRSARIAEIPPPALEELLSRRTDWVYYSAKSNAFTQGTMPDWALHMLRTRTRWPGVRDLDGIVESPVIRPDGTVLDKPGFDSDLGIFYSPIDPTEKIAVAESPTLEDAKTAVNALLEVVADFPFDNKEVTGLYQSCWLAAVLTPFARFAFSGPVPLFLADANVRAAGKSKLMDAAGLICFGREIAKDAYPENDDEMRKKVTAYALEGRRYVYFDNLKHSLGCPALDCALTTTVWSDRVLGESESTGELPLYAVWFATGNNIAIAADTARRVLHIRLNSPLEKPEEKAEFKHPDLLGWVRQERPRLATAALTILRAYHVAGCPKHELPAWGSFEGWSSLIRQALVWVGQPDPALSRKRLAEQNDRTAEGHAALLEQLAKRPEGAFSAGDLIAEADPYRFDGQESNKELRHVLAELTGEPASRLTATKVGRVLSGFVERVAEIGSETQRRRCRLTSRRTERGRVYEFEEIQPPGTAQPEGSS